MGHKVFEDGVIDILTWPLDGNHNGVTAENVAKKYHVTREEQDAFAVRSHQRACKAIKEGKFKDEILPVELKDRKGNVTIFDTDEGPREGQSMEKLAKLRPCFVKGGTVTAANSSSLNDGAAAVVVMSKEKAEELGVTPKVEIEGYAIAGFDAELMGYSPKFSSEKLADKLGAIINLDDITHIDFLEKTIGHIPETISCRYNPGGIFKISNDIMDNPGDSKYGMTTEQITEAFKTLKAKGAKEFGIHAFLASNTVTNDYYPMLAKVLFEQAVRLQKETGVHIKFINLSGGIGIPYTPDQEPNDIRVIGEGVRKVYEEVLVPAGMGDVAIYTELGRFMMGPYGCLVTKAIHEKNTYKNYIGVDACAVNLMRPAMYGAYHHITVLGKEDAPCDHKYDVTGSLCENNDKFAIDRMLPEVDMGDYLVIHDTGAHGFSMGYNYNGKLKSAELLLKEDGSVQMIRRAETPKDYFATFDCFDFYKKVLE